MSATEISENQAEKERPVSRGSYVDMEVQGNGVAVISFDVPDSKLNVLSETLMRKLDDILTKLPESKDVKGVIFVSRKKDNFIAGADITAIEEIQNQSPIHAYEASQLGKMLFEKIEKLTLPTVAAIDGQCLGGGLELSLACKRRIAADNGSTKLGFPEVALGFVPGWGGTVRAPRAVGLMNAMELILNPLKPAGSKKAWRMRLVDEMVVPEKLRARAEELALGAKPRSYQLNLKEGLTRFVLEGNPIGRALIKKEATKRMMKETRGQYPAPAEVLKLLFGNYHRSTKEAYQAESEAFARLACTQVSKNLVGIFFAQTESKKTPAKGTSEISVQTVGVLGAGIMGAGIAQAAAFSGYKVVLKDVEQKFVDKGMDVIKKLFDGLVERKRLKHEERDQMLSSITPAVDYDKVKDCDLVIEAVIEDMKVKQETVRKLDAIETKPYIFASNTSSLSLNELASASKNPDRVVGIHFFNPVHKMPLVEIVRGEKTSDDTVATAKQWAMKLGKTTVTVADAPGFVVNRILAPYLREAVILLEAGIAPELIDKVMTSFGMPMGPFTLMDEVGLDIGAKVTHVLYEALGERMSPPAIMMKLEHLKLLGKKGGKGFFLYDESGKKAGFNPDILTAIESAKSVIGPGVIQDRLILIMVNEAARCLEEGVIKEPSQLDLALVMGIGFPPFRGGILRYADQIGVKIVHQKLAFLSKVAGENYVPANLILKKVAALEDFYSE
jgi:3-hydroxyacyl-CoA dehydrogenase / enoyl-CoA hydratase / 3-hydroxybutyryl-CoA epimerase